MTITLNVTSDQEAFDKVYRHLTSIKHPAMEYSPKMGKVMCRYRTALNETCSIGCLIPVDQYDPEIEGKALNALLEEGWIAMTDRDINVGLLGDLQEVHDHAAYWGADGLDIEGHKMLANIAHLYNLTIPGDT